MNEDQPFKNVLPDVLALMPVHAISPDGLSSGAIENRAAAEQAEAKERVIEECKRQINLQMIYMKFAAK
jgi:hypothetical protein